jgi:hypothetical protein
MAAMVMIVLALGGLGCHNEAGGTPQAQPACIQSTGHCGVSAYLGPSSALGYSSPHETSSSGAGHTLDYPGGALRATLMSFILGHDDVPTVREIESAFYSGQYVLDMGYPISAARPVR